MAASRISLQLLDGEEIWVSVDSITHVVPPIAAGLLHRENVGCAIPNPAGGWFVLKHTMQELKDKLAVGTDGYPRRTV